MRNNVIRAALVAALALLCAGTSWAARPRVYAITGATVVIAPGEVVENGTVVLRDGLIEAVGASVRVPADAEVIDGTDRYIYAGLIDAHSDLGVQAATGGARGGGTGSGTGGGGFPRPAPTPPGAVHPLSLIRAEHQVRDRLASFTGDTLKTMQRTRELGFTITLAVPSRGILAGSSAAILLIDERPVAEMILADGVAQHAGFQRASFGQGYPTSLMGSVAAFRQTLLDAQRFVEWSERYEQDPSGLERPPFHATFDALRPVLEGRQRLIFVTTNPDDTLLAHRLAGEFDLNVAVSTSSAEWEVADQIAANGVDLIVSTGFPDKPKVKEDDEALGISRRTLTRYLDAAAGPARLHDAGVTFALSMHGLKNSGDFYKNVRKMIDAGLSTDTALAALTTVPAKLLGLDRVAGSISDGKLGNLVITDGPLFDEDSKIREVWVDGNRHEIEVKEKPKGDPNAVVDPTGEWSVSFDMGARTLERRWTIEGEPGNYSGTAETRSGSVAFDEVTLEGNALTVVLPGQGGRGSTEITVIIEDDAFEGTTEFGPRTVTLTGSRSGPGGGAR